MIENIPELLGMSVFTAGLTVGLNWMAMRGRIEIINVKVDGLKERLDRMEGRMDRHYNGMPGRAVKSHSG